MAQLTVGAAYADLARSDGLKLTYVGPAPLHEVFSAGDSHHLVQVMHTRVATDVVPWNGDAHRPLETGQMWRRSRHDYSGQVAEVLLPPFEHAGKSWVVYRVHYGAGNAEPKLKAEKDFRRIFGELIED